MTVEEKLTVFSEILKEEDILKAKGIHRENHKPHPYTVGPRHVKDAADNHGGMLGEATLQKIGCAHKGCTLAYEDHKSDNILFLQLTRDASEVEANEELIKIKDKLLELEINGVAFVDTEEQYRFLKDEEDGREETQKSNHS